MTDVDSARKEIVSALLQLEYLEEALAFSWPLNREDTERICSLAKRYVRQAHAALVTTDILTEPATPVEEANHA